MYAVIETGGKQYRVEVGTELAVELLEVEPGQEITLDRVLLVADGDEAAIGRPVVDGAVVSATVLRNDRAAKVISFKYKPKARRRVKKGHRQEQTVLRITDVALNGKSAAEEARKAAEAKRTERQRLEEAAATQAAADAALAATLAKKVAEAAPESEAPKKSRGRAPKAGAAKVEKAAAEAPADAEAEARAAEAPAEAAEAEASEAVEAEAPEAPEVAETPDVAGDAAETGTDDAPKPRRSRAAKKED
jgi:large subunit ribosomal protein L21